MFGQKLWNSRSEINSKKTALESPQTIQEYYNAFPEFLNKFFYGIINVEVCSGEIRSIRHPIQSKNGSSGLRMNGFRIIRMDSLDKPIGLKVSRDVTQISKKGNFVSSQNRNLRCTSFQKRKFFCRSYLIIIFTGLIFTRARNFGQNFKKFRPNFKKQKLTNIKIISAKISKIFQPNLQNFWPKLY